MLAIESPLPLFVGRDGLPLDAGYIYFGTVNLNPVTSPVTVYWDAAGTQPVAQPVRTSRGLIVRSGTPAKVYASGNFSILVKDSTGAQVVYERNSSEWQVSAYVDELRTDLASKTDAGDGSGLSGHSASLNYPVGTVGAALNDSCLNVKMYPWLAKGDGVTDDTAAIQAAISSLTDGQSLDFCGSTYFVKNLTVNKNRVTLKNGKFISDASLMGSLFLVTGDDVHFENISTYLNPAAYSVSVGAIGFDGVVGGSVVGCNLDGCRRSGANTVQSSLVAVYDSSGVVVERSTLANAHFTESVLLMDSTDCRVVNNTITGGGVSYSAIASDHTPTTGELIGRHVVANNTLSDFDTSVITLNSAENTVTGNIIDGSATEQGINLGHSGRGAPRSVVSCNVVKNCVGDGIAIADSPGTLVTGNVITNCETSGIAVVNASDDVVIEGNTIKDIAGGASDGIRVSSGSEPNYIAIYNNYLKNIDGHGIAAYGGNSLDIDGNTMINVHNASGGLPGGRFAVLWNATTSPSLQKLYFKNNSVTSDASLIGPGPSRGISVDASVAALDLSMVGNDLSAVTSTQLFWVTSGVQPAFKDMRKNKRTDDPFIGSATLASGAASVVISNSNQTTAGAPRITYRDANGPSRTVHVSAYTTGSFTLAGNSVGSDAVIEYEIV